MSPSLGRTPSLLLDLAKPQVCAALHTQHTPLVADGAISAVGFPVSCGI
ncbi:hypothetical protein BLL52_3386 [Rhodoferax antarcticus ANT.BR]|uniref:Uncharacterized protein n=1 Tax=Rhodoferax antarcticus ANT.BR TaxID=1111071 RepID=A0A1Q8YB05_9BURK|nr:hypothetical protein BLL52_3386 [Rhodoferax antarcticus ANT.BR]